MIFQTSIQVTGTEVLAHQVGVNKWDCLRIAEKFNVALDLKAKRLKIKRAETCKKRSLYIEEQSWIETKGNAWIHSTKEQAKGKCWESEARRIFWTKLNDKSHAFDAIDFSLLFRIMSQILCTMRVWIAKPIKNWCESKK